HYSTSLSLWLTGWTVLWFWSFCELQNSNTARHYSLLHNTSDYRVLLMDEDHDRMYVGTQDYIVSLDLHNINREPLIIHWPVSQQRRDDCVLSGKDQNGECANFICLIQPWNRTHLYVCGTGAYHPICSYVNRGRKAEVRAVPPGEVSRVSDTCGNPSPGLTDYIFHLEPGKVESGKGKCSYDPKLNSVSSLINRELYAGVYIDFMGTDAAIFRTMGPQTAMRTDQYNSRWLNDPEFIHAQLIPDSSERNDDKLYFFFREKASDSGSSAVYSRIGRICLNDDGGHCCLVNKWSTFLKARLICSVPGPDGIETHFDELQDIFVQRTQDVKNPVIYAVFSSSGSVFKGSAVCVYSMTDIRTVFNGPFAHKEGPNYQWMPFTGKIPYPRPGTCPGGTFTPSMRSTKDYPDEVINFMRNHPTMYNSVYPVHKRPLVVRTNVNYEFTTITVDQVDAADGRYEVLFLGTDRGTVQKVIVLPKDEMEREELILEEVEVFKVSQQLYVGSTLGITQVTLHRCDVYGEACADCCLARDPYCAWDGKACSRYSASSKRRSRRQDVRHGNPIRQCRGYNSNANRKTMETEQYGVEGSSTFLECQPKSPQATIKWVLQREGSDRKKEIKSDERILRTDQGLLLRSLQLADGGIYQCTATENNFKHALVRVHLRVLNNETVNLVLTHSGLPMASLQGVGSPGTSRAPNPQYKDLLQLLSQPEMGVINQYCEGYWQRPANIEKQNLNKQQKDKPVREQRKPRNRRNHHTAPRQQT
uniref:Sema domain, immunoglobulin domain (Ig), short basic domain, secreted, (semaphorin) 3Fa n=1 Tax=Callorhinchus milii TaxID=7868 RepID=A0A4W3JXT8_CALMI